MNNRNYPKDEFLQDNLDQEDCNNLFNLLLKENLRLPNPNDQKQDDYDNLFKFIRKNTKLKKAIANIPNSTSDMEKTNQLLTAIQHGDFNSSVFKDDRVDVFLLYLIKENMIYPDNAKLNFDSGMTVYLHILGLRQYGNLPPISCWAKNLQDIGNSADSVVNKKFNVKMEMLRFYCDGKLTIEGEAYIKSLRDALHDETKGPKTDLEIGLNIQHFSEYIAALPPVEQSLTKLSNVSGSPFLRIVANNFPFIYPEWSNNGKSSHPDIAYVPSVSILNYLMNTLFLKPVKFQFCFGLAGLDTLYNMHADRLHPCSLNSNLIQSNPIAHESKDAFAIPLHDCLHAFLGSLLSDSEYQFLFNSFIPKLGGWKKITDLHHDSATSQSLADAILRLSELNLTNIHSGFVDSCHRFENFVKYSLGVRNCNHDESTSEFRNELFLFLAVAYFKNIGGEHENKWLQLFAGELYFFLLRTHDKPMSHYRELTRAILIVCSQDIDIVQKLTAGLTSNTLWQSEPVAGYLDFACDQLKRKSTMDYAAAKDLLLKNTKELNVSDYFITYILKALESKLVINNTRAFSQQQLPTNFRFWTQQPVNNNQHESNTSNAEILCGKQIG